VRLRDNSGQLWQIKGTLYSERASTISKKIIEGKSLLNFFKKNNFVYKKNLKGYAEKR
jgi:hypothetical protein